MIPFRIPRRPEDQEFAMHHCFTSIAIVLCLFVAVTRSTAAEVSAKVIDHLNRPVAGASFDMYWLKSVSKDNVKRIDLATLRSHGDGTIRGTFDESTIPKGEDFWVNVSKDGYAGYSQSGGLKSRYELVRNFGPADVRRIANLPADEIFRELRELLAGRFDRTDMGLNELIFVQEAKFRPVLRALILDPIVGTEAGQLLAFIGVPEDIRLFLEHAPPPKREFMEDQWAYSIATALLDPTTDAEWDFLRRCANNDYDDLWVDAGAIEALMLIASPRSRQILDEAREKNNHRAKYIQSAIDYIDSAPAPLSDEDLEKAGKKVAQAIKIGKWQGNKPPQYNTQKDKALIACQFLFGCDWLVHTATFHKINGVWKLRGVRETMQALLAFEPDDDKDTAEAK